VSADSAACKRRNCHLTEEKPQLNERFAIRYNDRPKRVIVAPNCERDRAAAESVSLRGIKLAAPIRG
jgi:hypothetical protein